MYDPQFAFEDACLNNDVVLVNHLLDTVDSIEITSTLLTDVCRYGRLDSLKILILRVEDPYYLLYDSCKYNQIYIVDYLLNSSHDGIVNNIQYTNALSVAVSNGHTEILKNFITQIFR